MEIKFDCAWKAYISVYDLGRVTSPRPWTDIISLEESLNPPKHVKENEWRIHRLNPDKIVDGNETISKLDWFFSTSIKCVVICRHLTQKISEWIALHIRSYATFLDGVELWKSTGYEMTNRSVTGHLSWEVACFTSLISAKGPKFRVGGKRQWYLSEEMWSAQPFSDLKPHNSVRVSHVSTTNPRAADSVHEK